MGLKGEKGEREKMVMSMLKFSDNVIGEKVVVSKKKIK